MPGAGALDRRIVIEELVETTGVTGDPVQTWQHVIEVRAFVQPVRATERFAAGQQLAERTAVFQIRWRSGITPRHRIVYDGVNWDIEGLAERGRRQFLEITAVAQH